MIKRIVCGITLMMCAFALALCALFTLVLWNHDGDLDALVLTGFFSLVSLCSASGAVFISVPVE